MYSYALIMMNALKYLPTSTYFIGVRLGSSFVLLAFGIIFFKDIISNLEFFGYILGIFAIILLFEKEKKEKTNFKKGVPILLFGILSLVVGHSITKYFSLNNEITPSILTLAFLFSIIFSFIFGYKNIKKNLIHLKPIFLINLVQGFLYVFYFIMLFYVYKIGDLGISYKIQSYSPFIPIILSAIIYKEKITKKRALAIVLTILSLWFFV
ncbi:MAG: EamA family transporter [Nanoarchaeota archaeon]|nr:EamA family transporter [Nanoarchaeota archaeon]